tara:strand:+ start:35821 stop:36951 length:1131 start_codon:yes stop_codon:yes gene_type:complete
MSTSNANSEQNAGSVHAPSICVIAEAGVNHNGDLDLARQLVDAAAEAGADVVKFQTFRADALVTKTAPKAAYQARNTSETETQHQMLTRLELSMEAHRALLQYCNDRGIAFLSSPFDIGSLHFLTQELGLTTIKLGSGELTNAPLLIEAARSGCSLILSTGMSTLGDVEQALGVLAFAMDPTAKDPGSEAFLQATQNTSAWQAMRKRVTLLHCTTQYPAPISSTNLRAMVTIRDAFGLQVGYSDHTEGISMSVAAAAMGATVIEKHITLDKTLPGPDHRASADPGEFRSLVAGVREVELGLGSGIKQPAEAEMANRSVARKSLRAAREISAGATLNADDIIVARPGDGISPMRYWSALGTISKRDYQPGDPLELPE